MLGEEMSLEEMSLVESLWLVKIVRSVETISSIFSVCKHSRLYNVKIVFGNNMRNNQAVASSD